MQKKAIILFSGGLDSTTCLAFAKDQGFACYALTLDYGQRNYAELAAAKRCAQQAKVVEHKIISVPLSSWGGSALTDNNIAVPDYQGDGNIPVTYVPARNIIFLSLAVAWAEVIGANDIFYGANAIDYSGYPDCRPDFVAAYQKMINIGTKIGDHGQPFTIHAPLISLHKADIIRLGVKLGIDYAQTVSCYQANDAGYACGRCDPCHLRKSGFMQAEMADPTRYLMNYNI